MNNIVDKNMLERVKQEEKSTKINNDKYKLGFHLMPPTGWLNDPNGLCQFNGVYHVFFQYSPFDANGAEKFWGHYTSKDMISWDYVGVAMAPDKEFDKDGVYSGGALVENNKMYLYYTGNVKEDGKHDYITSGRQANTILVISEDGKHLSEKKLIMTNDDYPSTYTCHIRDPKVWKENEQYYMLLGGREMVDGTEINDIGKILVYSSSDLENWKLENEIKTNDRFGYMWECPDMITINENKFLGLSPQGLKSEEFKYQNIYQSGYFPLTGDFKDKYSLGSFEEWDMGFDFYAPQTFVDESGRTILIGWMGLPDIDYTNKTLEYGWQHNLTIPRQLSLKDNKLLQNPVEELKILRTKEQEFDLNKNIKINSLSEIEINGNIKKIEILLAGGLKVKYDIIESAFIMEFKNKIGAGRTERKVKLKKLDKLHIFVDKSCVEIFLNGGEKVLSTRFYPQEYTMEVMSEDDIKIKLWDLKPMEVNF